MAAENVASERHQRRMRVFSAFIFAISPSVGALAMGASTLIADTLVTQPQIAGLQVVGVQSEINPNFITVKGHVHRNRMTQILQSHELVISIIDEAGREVLSEHQAVGPHQLPRRSSKNFYFSTTLAHELRSGERIVVNIVRTKS